VVNGLLPNTYYRFRIAAINVNGRGPVSEEVMIKTGSVANIFNTVPAFLEATSGVTEQFSAAAAHEPNTTSNVSITFRFPQIPAVEKFLRLTVGMKFRRKMGTSFIITWGTSPGFRTTRI